MPNVNLSGHWFQTVFLSGDDYFFTEEQFYSVDKTETVIKILDEWVGELFTVYDRHDQVVLFIFFQWSKKQNHQTALNFMDRFSAINAECQFRIERFFNPAEVVEQLQKSKNFIYLIFNRNKSGTAVAAQLPKLLSITGFNKKVFSENFQYFSFRYQLLKIFPDPQIILDKMPVQQVANLWEELLQKDFITTDMMRGLIAYWRDNTLYDKLMQGISKRIKQDIFDNPPSNYKWAKTASYLSFMNMRRLIMRAPLNSYSLGSFNYIRKILQRLNEMLFLNNRSFDEWFSLPHDRKFLHKLFTGTDLKDWGVAGKQIDPKILNRIMNSISIRSRKLLDAEVEYWSSRSDFDMIVSAQVRIIKKMIALHYSDLKLKPLFNEYIEHLINPEVLQVMLEEQGLHRFFAGVQTLKTERKKEILKAGLDQEAFDVIQKLQQGSLRLSGNPTGSELERFDREMAEYCYMLYLEGTLRLKKLPVSLTAIS